MNKSVMLIDDLYPGVHCLKNRPTFARFWLFFKNRSHIPWDPFKDKGVLGESKGAKHATRDGETTVKLDPLGVLIMGKMPGLNEGKIMPI